MNPESIFEAVFGRITEKTVGYLMELRGKATDQEFKQFLEYLSKKGGGYAGRYVYDTHSDVIDDHINKITDKYNKKPDGSYRIESIHIDAEHAARIAASDIFYKYH